MTWLTALRDWLFGPPEEPQPLIRYPDAKVLTPFRNCPHCGCGSFRKGPRGGAAVNITCELCQAKFNVADIPGGPFLLEELPHV